MPAKKSKKTPKKSDNQWEDLKVSPSKRKASVTRPSHPPQQAVSQPPAANTRRSNRASNRDSVGEGEVEVVAQKLGGLSSSQKSTKNNPNFVSDDTSWS
jgi:hypothetical protein